MPQSFHIHPSANLPACLLRTDASSVKAIVKTPSKIPPYQTTIPPSSNPPLGVHLSNIMYSISSKRPYMDYNSSPDTDFTKLSSTLKDMGLEVYPQYPCIYMGTLTPGGRGGSTLAYPLMTLSILSNLTRWNNSSEQFFHQRYNSTGRVMHTGYLVHYYSGPHTKKMTSPPT